MPIHATLFWRSSRTEQIPSDRLFRTVLKFQKPAILIAKMSRCIALRHSYLLADPRNAFTAV
jgi:hypothetical protein